MKMRRMCILALAFATFPWSPTGILAQKPIVRGAPTAPCTSQNNSNPPSGGGSRLEISPTAIDSDYDGIPDDWEIAHGLNPKDGNDSVQDPDHDGWANIFEYLNGTDPAHPDTLPNMVVNNGSPFSVSRTITIQLSNVVSPNIRVSLDPSMADAMVLPNSGSLITYDLPDIDGSHDLHLQCADAQGRPCSAMIFRSVTLDRCTPVVYITSPASNAILDQAFIDLYAVAADSNSNQLTVFRRLNIWINGVRFWDRSGTNIIIERFPVPMGTSRFSVHIVVADEAGNSNEIVRTWTVDPQRDKIAPRLSSFNIPTNMALPDVSELWVEAAVDDKCAFVRAIVSFDASEATTNSLNVRGHKVEGLVPLQFGTNRVVISASDAAGNATSNVFTIVRTNRYRALITSPKFGEFATSASTYVSGYVSAKIDEGLPTETKVVGVLINGVPTVLDWSQVDAEGNVPFRATNAIPLGVPITGEIIEQGGH